MDKEMMNNSNGMQELSMDDMDVVSGGYGPWQQYAKGSYVNYGQYIVYTVVGLAGLWCVSFLFRRRAIIEGE